ncbi:MAG: alpha/beta hydrolase [Clostridia bacterium]|nr:alpha/beta hydrolase [Clostridia bacterium]
MIYIETVDLYNLYPQQARGEGGLLTVYALEPIVKVDPDRRFPAVLILPGGAYSWVSPREAEPVAMRFLSRGFSCFLLNYSCAPARFPVALREAAMAMNYIRSQADRLHVDPNHVAALGFSAGGHLCGTLGTLFDAEDVSDIAPAAIIRPDALVLCYPVSVSSGRTHAESFSNLCGNDRALMERLSLDKLVRRDMMPVFLWHTRNDASVPVDGTLKLASALAEKDVPFTLHVFAEGRHGLATADDLVYRRDDLPPLSDGVIDWPELVVRFLWENGFHIQDSE